MWCSEKHSVFMSDSCMVHDFRCRCAVDTRVSARGTLAVCVHHCVFPTLCVNLTPCDTGHLQACNDAPHGYVLCDCVCPCLCRSPYVCLAWCQSDTAVVTGLGAWMCHFKNGSFSVGGLACSILLSEHSVCDTGGDPIYLFMALTCG